MTAHRFFGTSIMRTAYGFDDIKQNETAIHDAEQVLAGFTDAITPGKFLVNMFPILKHVPSWFPGAGFQTYCKTVAEVTRRTKNAPFVGVKASLVRRDNCRMRYSRRMLMKRRRRENEECTRVWRRRS